MNIDLNEYAFDLTLTASLRVKAPDEKAARRMLYAALDCADANLGAWPNGDPILSEVSLVDNGPLLPPTLYEVNGEPV